MAVLREIVCARVGLLFEQFVDASHFVDCLVKVEVQFGYDAQLMALHMSHLAADLGCVVLHLSNRASHFVLWKYAQVNVCNTEVR